MPLADPIAERGALGDAAPDIAEGEAAEQRVVLAAMARRLDLVADRPEPEHAQHRNVTMIPARGARAILRARTP